MGALRKYRVRLNGQDTVVKLSDAEVALYPDAVPVDAAPPAPLAGQRRARTPTNKARTGLDAPADK